jgi:hypothetical protein
MLPPDPKGKTGIQEVTGERQRHDLKAKRPPQAVPYTGVHMAEIDKTKSLLESLRAEPCAVCIEKVGTVSPDSDERCALCGKSFKQRLASFSPKR